MNFWQEYNYNAEKEMPVAGLEPATILFLPATNSTNFSWKHCVNFILRILIPTLETLEPGNGETNLIAENLKGVSTSAISI